MSVQFWFSWAIFQQSIKALLCRVPWRLELRDHTISTSLHDEDIPLYRVGDIRTTGICLRECHTDEHLSSEGWYASLRIGYFEIHGVGTILSTYCGQRQDLGSDITSAPFVVVEGSPKTRISFGLCFHGHYSHLHS